MKFGEDTDYSSSSDGEDNNNSEKIQIEKVKNKKLDILNKSKKIQNKKIKKTA